MHRNKGSSLLMVICFTGTISLMALGVWRNTMYCTEAALARMAYMQRIKSAEGLMNVAIEVTMENYTSLIKRTQPIVIDLPGWFTQHNQTYRGEISISPQKNDIELQIFLKNGFTAASSIRCHISRDLSSINSFQITSWVIDKQS